MISKIVFTLLTVIAISEAAKLSYGDNKELVPVEKESRVLLEIPIIGAITYKTLKVSWFLLKSVFAVISYKFAALALAANVAIWFFENSYTLLMGASLAFGFCKFTGFCNWYPKEQLMIYNDQLLYAGKSLESGIKKYADRS